MKRKSNKKKKKISIIKRVLIVFGSLTVVFAIINLAWLLLIYMPYKNYCQRSELFCDSSKYTENEMMAYNTYYDDRNEYGYKIYKPEYLSFVGLTLAIGDNRHVKSTIDGETGEVIEKDPPLIIINIVRNVFGKYTFHLSILEAGGEMFDVTIDKSMSIIESTSKEKTDKMNELIDQNREHLGEIMDYAVEMWNIK